MVRSTLHEPHASKQTSSLENSLTVMRLSVSHLKPLGPKSSFLSTCAVPMLYISVSAGSAGSE
jgi:hypothetical protein